MIDYSDVQKLDMRIGRIVLAEDLENEGYVSHKLVIDFGSEIGHKVALARLAAYTKETLEGKQIIGIVNVNPKQMGMWSLKW